MIWEGYFHANTGYGEAARGYALGLAELGLPVGIRSFEFPDDRFLFSPELLAQLKALTRQDRDGQELRVQHLLPSGYQLDETPRFNIGYAAFDANRIPHSWVRPCNQMDEVWVPSRFCKRAFALAGVVESKIRVIPHGADLRRFGPHVDPLKLESARGFKFFSVFDWVKRKGWDLLLRAYLLEFRAQEEVCLILRVARFRPLELARFIQKEFGPGPRPAIIILPFGTPFELMPRLYAAADAFVLPSRGEGWCLPYSEAMATGLPTIATKWGGQLDYMNDGNSYLLETEGLAPIDEERRAYLGAEDDLKEAKPSVDHLRQLMRHIYEHPEEARTRGKHGRQSLLKRTWQQAAREIWARVEALEGTWGVPLKTVLDYPPKRSARRAEEELSRLAAAVARHFLERKETEALAGMISRELASKPKVGEAKTPPREP